MNSSAVANRETVNLSELNNSNMFKRGRITTPNVYTAQLRVINNIRMQRACRYSIKRLAINNIVDNSNYHRLFTGDPSQYPFGGMDGTKGQNVVNITLPNKDRKNPTNRAAGGGGGNGGGPAVGTFDVLQMRQNPIMINANIFPMGSANGNDLDFKLFQFKKKQAELKRNQLEDDLKENHPYFDKPLFTIGRESNFRRFCQMIVEARYKREPRSLQRDQSTSGGGGAGGTGGAGGGGSSSLSGGSPLGKDKYKQFYKFLGLVSYLDWIMIAVTIQSCIGMMFETPEYRLVESLPLQIAEYLFVVCMSIEMTLKGKHFLHFLVEYLI